MEKQTRIFNLPFQVIVLTMFIVAIGVVMVYSASGRYASHQRRVAVLRQAGSVEALEDDHQYHNARFLVRQLFWVCLGLAGMFVTYHLDYRRLKDAGPLLLGLSFLLLILVFIPGLQVIINGHKRWIGFGGFTFQPSELAKLAMVIYMARMLTDKHDKITTSFVHGVIPALALMGAFGLVICLEPDLGAAAVLTAITFTMWFIAGMRVRHLAALLIAVIPAFVFAVFMFPDRIRRVVAFINPTEENRMNAGYQLWQSLIAVGRGGLSGVGLGNSMQKHFLTEQYSEFIFAIWAEEAGFIGAVLLVVAFLGLIVLGFRIALSAPDFYGMLLACGITLMLAVNAILNFMVVLGLAPTKGLSLPLVSYGGSNMLVTLTGMGILMNVAKYVEKEREMRRAAPSRVKKSGRTRSRKRKERKRWFEGEMA